MRWTTLGGYPVKQYNSPNRGGAMDAHRGVVCHIAEGTYQGTISWQMNPNQRYASGQSVNTCSTWIVGKNAGEIAQMVDTDEIAWCQRSGSRTWLSIEFAGYNTQALTEWQIEAAALILAAVHERYGVPLQVAATPATGGLGHHSMDRESSGEEWGHEDCPGPKIIAQKPQIVARAIEIAGGDDMNDAQDKALMALRNGFFYGGPSMGDPVDAENVVNGTRTGGDPKDPLVQIADKHRNGVPSQLKQIRANQTKILDALANPGSGVTPEQLAELGTDVADRLGALRFVATDGGQA